MVGFAYLLAEDQGTLSAADQHEYLQMIAKSGQRMCNIIDELLLLSSVRKVGQVTLGPVDMGSIVGEVLERLNYLIEPHQAIIHYPEEWPQGIGYAAWIEEVWVNYVSNGIKYGGQPPHVELGATAEEGQQRIRFWVRDNGSGLTPEEQGRLFTPFTRLDQTRARGHGLGLSIVRRIVGRLDGSVGVESQIGSGTTFWFTLPAA
jgi:signal transduction histidine kinase